MRGIKGNFGAHCIPDRRNVHHFGRKTFDDNRAKSRAVRSVGYGKLTRDRACRPFGACRIGIQSPITHDRRGAVHFQLGVFHRLLLRFGAFSGTRFHGKADKVGLNISRPFKHEGRRLIGIGFMSLLINISVDDAQLVAVGQHIDHRRPNDVVAAVGSVHGTDTARGERNIHGDD